jgi:hypothetical protein
MLTDTLPLASWWFAARKVAMGHQITLQFRGHDTQLHPTHLATTADFLVFIA